MADSDKAAGAGLSELTGELDELTSSPMTKSANYIGWANVGDQKVSG